MKKIFLLCFMAVNITSFSFGQIFRCEAEGKNGHVNFSLHFLEYAKYRYLLFTEDVSIFLDEDTLAQFKAALEKFTAWEALAQEGKISVTRSIDSIMFTTYYQHRGFVRDPAFFHLIFTTTTQETSAEGEAPVFRYTLFVDTSLDAFSSFRLSSNQVKEFLEALAPDKLAEAEEVYLQKKALEELFFN